MKRRTTGRSPGTKAGPAPSATGAALPAKGTATLLSLLSERVGALEAERAVRHTITRYMALCDVPSGALDGEALADLFATDAVWEGIGPQYAEKFGKLEGRAAILAMLTRYLPPTPHFAVNVHFLAAENIDVKGAYVKSRWIMLQASGYVDARAELIGARLDVDFAPAAVGHANDSEAWLITHFRTERLFDAPWQVNPRPGCTAQPRT